MVESADEPPIRGLHSWAKSKAFPFLISPRSSKSKKSSTNHQTDTLPQHVGNTEAGSASASTSENVVHNLQDTHRQGSSVVDKKGDGEKSSSIEDDQSENEKQPVFQRFIRDVKRIITCSWINWLLVFVPVGIILGAVGDWGQIHIVSPSVIFALNAVAIIPLASLLAFATESVAIKMGDTYGALLNVTFGNAVEIIVFVIGLVANEVRVVQAAALGSILSNLLLILGMCFVFGGLRFREQLYNPTVSQMSSCLLSLSVISLLLPTAFHAAFDNGDTADRIVLKVSRGTSVVLLLVYILYLLFQLKSHAFMYESTPQHIIDEESHPGVLADMLNNSSSSSDSSSSSSSDSDDTSGSHKTANKIKRALRRKRRKSVSSTRENPSPPPFSRSDTNATTLNEVHMAGDNMASGDEADGEDCRSSHLASHEAVHSRDFERETKSLKEKRKRRKAKKADRSTSEPEKEKPVEAEPSEQPIPSIHVGFSGEVQQIPDESVPRRPFHLRHISEAVKPAFNSNVFPHHEATGRPLALPALRPYDRNPDGSMRRASSMPDIHRQISHGQRAASPRPHGVSNEVPVEVPVVATVEPNQHLSRTSAIILLLCTTALVALCAEFLVGSIDYLVSNSGVSQTFIGLIILPIVGNAAEHVTAVTVAYKNKMDLAINIALGSSIQIALFVTPLMVMLGWAIGAEMSLYFSLFETMSLFGSAFIVNFLMIDGRSNYLEGTLLIAAYVIIAIAAFFYPTCGLSAAGGPMDGATVC